MIFPIFFPVFRNNNNGNDYDDDDLEEAKKDETEKNIYKALNNKTCGYFCQFILMGKDNCCDFDRYMECDSEHKGKGL